MPPPRIADAARTFRHFQGFGGPPQRAKAVPVRVRVVAMLTMVGATIAGCAVGPPYSRPPVDQPAVFRSPVPASDEAAIPEDWWRLYSDPTLDGLIAEANAANQTLRQAVARVDEARALARVAASFRYPTISANPIVSRERLSGNRASELTGAPVSTATTINDWLLPVDLTYEVDVWGRVRRSLQAARAQFRASADDEAVIRLGVQTDVAQLYFTLRLLDAQLEILDKTILSYREQVRLLGAQSHLGLADAIVLNQGVAQLQSTLAQREDVARARADQEHALAILCGRAAPTFELPPHPITQGAPPVVPAGLPATVLTRRPDVAEAEQRLVAANALVGVAIADMRPQFTLTSSAGFESSAIQSLFAWQSALASIAQGLTAPIFNAGRLKANLHAVRAQYEQTLAAYTNQVLIAYGDVEDALTDLHAETAEAGNLAEAVVASGNYWRLAQAQYANGLIDYLIVIDAERTLLANQLALAQASSAQMSASVHLIKALGGGWQSQP